MRPYAIVIPCHNEEIRFPFDQFLNFAKENPEVILCFVNDGSTDKTLSVLKNLQKLSPTNIHLLNLLKNGDKSEAVRQGMLYIHMKFNASLIGFLNADLTILPQAWLAMAKYEELYPQYGAVVGSRFERFGANNLREDNRPFMRNLVEKFIHVILKTSFQDTQCGAKVFHRSLIPFLFNQPFLTPWLFEEEIFLRLQNKFGKSTLQNGVFEFPLMHWTKLDNTRLKFNHAIKISFQLFKLYYQYRLTKQKIGQPTYKPSIISLVTSNA